MRALHLFANWKWTGPAELAVNLCRGLRGAGVACDIAVGRGPTDGPASVEWRARERGVEPVLPELTLAKHVRLVANVRDARRVRAYVAAERPEIVHAHLRNDHVIAALALRGSRAGARLVRTCYDGDAVPGGLRHRFALARTDALILVSQAALEDAVGRHGYPRERAHLVEAPVDLARFDPARPLPDMRARLGIPEGAFVVGIVARMQRHRRFDVLLEGVRRAAAHIRDLHLVVVGRGTHQDEVAKEPAKALGIADLVHFPGYIDGDDYVGALAAFDAKIFLVPGSDGSCRAVREAMAMGKPVIAARRGMLPEIVRDEQSGLVIDDDPDGIARAIARLARDRDLARRMGKAALEDARARFGIEGTAQAVKAIYERTLAMPPR